MNREGRLLMHARLGGVVKELLADELAVLVPRSMPQIAVGLVPQHTASTSVLVLNCGSTTRPRLRRTPSTNNFED